MKVKGESVEIEVVVDDGGELLGLDILTSEPPRRVPRHQEVVEAVEPDVLVTDDHGAYTEVVDAMGLDHQICRSHVQRNVDAIAESLNKHRSASRNHSRRGSAHPSRYAPTSPRCSTWSANVQRMVKYNSEHSMTATRMYPCPRTVSGTRSGTACAWR